MERFGLCGCVHVYKRLGGDIVCCSKYSCVHFSVQEWRLLQHLEACMHLLSGLVGALVRCGDITLVSRRVPWGRMCLERCRDYSVVCLPCTVVRVVVHYTECGYMQSCVHKR